MKQTSGMDFHDRPLSDQHVDLPTHNTGAEPSHLSRNRNERRRLQGLILSSKQDTVQEPFQPKNFRQRLELWMIHKGAKRLFIITWIFLHLFVTAFGFVHYQLNDRSEFARQTFGFTYTLARTAALVLHVDVIFILLPVCRNFMSVLRRTSLRHFIPFEENITFHVLTGWTIVTGSIVHILSHIVNFIRLAMSIEGASAGRKFVIFLSANFVSGPGVTGWIMTICLGVMAAYSRQKTRKANYEAFWYSHHLFIVFFIMWQFHGMFCMIKPDRPPYCSFNTIGVFWRYWLIGGLIWVAERILREIRSRHRTYISKVIQHPSNVIELQIRKDKTKVRAGQYIFLSCPEISYFQWHPFTLTSAPEEDYLSIHVRIVGDFTRALSKAVGCDELASQGNESKGGGSAQSLDLNRTMPRVMIDGPFGSASEDFLNYETVMLVGAGIGVTPFASILKSIWYRMNNLNFSKPTRLSKVYFTWVIRDYESAEWFHSLLQAIEEQDTLNRIEINIYLTGQVKDDDLNNIVVHDVGAEKDTITSLRAPTLFGRPRWDKLFSTISGKHKGSDIGVIYCGPSALGKQLHACCNKFSDPRGARFFFGKENF